MPNLTRLGGVVAKCIGLQFPVPPDVQGDSGKSVPLSGLQFSQLPSGVPKREQRFLVCVPQSPGVSGVAPEKGAASLDQLSLELKVARGQGRSFSSRHLQPCPQESSFSVTAPVFCSRGRGGKGEQSSVKSQKKASALIRPFMGEQVASLQSSWGPGS